MVKHFIEKPTTEEKQPVENLLEQYVKKNDKFDGIGTDPISEYFDKNGNFIGGLTMSISQEWVWLDNIFVVEELRRRGLGTRFIKDAEEYAKSQGCTNVYLNISGTSNPSFFEAVGYKLIYVQPWKNELSSAYWMEKDLESEISVTDGLEFADSYIADRKFVADAKPEQYERIVNLVKEYSKNQTSSKKYEENMFEYFDDNKKLLGGLIFTVDGEWLNISTLCVSEDLRHSGLGSQLVKDAEKFAISKGCTNSYLFTANYQAPGFYQKLGYTIKHRRKFKDDRRTMNNMLKTLA